MSLSDKPFDIVVFGASGYTGRLVAEYLAAEYAGSDLKWAMAGRSLDKLAAVRAEMGISDAVDLLAVDVDNPDSVTQMVEACRVVITTVGPYQLYGDELVKQCAERGTDYVDLTGEPSWMHETIAQYSSAAKASGARIVHSCGFDSIPFDLGVYFLQKAAIASTGKPMPRVRGRVRAMNGEFSGGTAASLGATMAALKTNPDLINVLANPFSLANGFQGPEQPSDAKPYDDEAIGSWVAPFIMAPINTKNVHRSNALLNHLYGEDFKYDEMMVTGPGDQGAAAAKMVASSNPLEGDDVPKPGEGPSKESREAGHYDVLFVGTNDEGGRMEATVTGDMDPGYGSTSKMIAESALCIVHDCSDLPGGIYTPAPAMGEKLIERLVANAALPST